CFREILYEEEKRMTPIIPDVTNKPIDHGYEAWLRYDRLPAAPAEALQAWSRQLVMPEQEGVLLAVRRELTGGLTKMTGAEPVVTRALGAKPAIVAVTAEQAV